MTFDEVREFGTGSDETRSVVLADLNSDGALDIVAGNIGEPNAVYLAERPGHFGPGIPFGHDEQTYASTVADLDRDGDLDIILANVREPNALYFNSGNGELWREKFIEGFEESTYGVVAADVNGDGYPDLAFANSESLNRLYLNVDSRK